MSDITTFMKQSTAKFDLLFETSWEVCNKVGGIYTVLSTKAKTLQKIYKDKTIFIGPDVWTEENPSPYFVESKSIMKEWAKNAVLPEGLSYRIGRWDIPGRPIVILVDFKNLYSFKNQLYSEMWEAFGVDSLHAYGDYDEACMFAYAAATVIESISLYYRDAKPSVLAHFDEWTTGMGLLYIKKHAPWIGTIFTTHATSIGRSICGNNKPLYDYLKGYNGDQMAQQLNMQSKHSLEKAAAHNADSFTTVSEVTAIECEQLLEITPIVTPNGFEANFVPAKSKFAEARAEARKSLLDVASSLLGHRVQDNAFIIITSGRNEFRNKGLDLFIDALNKMRSSAAGVKREIIAFVMTPAWVAGPREDLQRVLANNSEERLSNPMITHNIHNFDSDAIWGKINYLGMYNGDMENVKIIYVPSYLEGFDGIFNKSYYQLLIGADASAFPSYYEPWGYTPLESVAFGVPTVTTDLSGFGQWVLSNFENSFGKCGVKVLHRSDSNYYNVVDELAAQLTLLASMPDNLIEVARKAAMDTAKCASWANFIDFYTQAYNQAAQNAASRLASLENSEA